MTHTQITLKQMPWVFLWQIRRQGFVRRLVHVFVLVTLACPAYAATRQRTEDAVVVEQSDLIVVGHLQDGSVKHIRNNRKPTEGSTIDHYATLVVRKVLKGESKAKDLPIHFRGLYPVVGGRSPALAIQDSENADRRGTIEIRDGVFIVRVVKDAREDYLWFLRKRTDFHPYGADPIECYEVRRPEEIQPVMLKDYFQAYLAKDPEQAVKQQMAGNALVFERATRYLQHCEVQRILALKDPHERVAKLFPYYLENVRWYGKFEARQGLIACGAAAGPHLIELFNDPNHQQRRLDIISMWGEMRYEGAVDVLVPLLKAADPQVALAQKHQELFSEIQYSIYNLGQIGDPRAIEAIQLTKQRWQNLGTDESRRVVHSCDCALRVIAAKRPMGIG
jgi:hypothetical protein